MRSGSCCMRSSSSVNAQISSIIACVGFRPLIRSNRLILSAATKSILAPAFRPSSGTMLPVISTWPLVAG